LEKIKNYLFDKINIIYDKDIQENLNNKFKKVINIFNDEIENCYKEGLEKIKNLSDEKLAKVIEINFKYESDLAMLESTLDYSKIIYNYIYMKSN